MHVPWMHAQMHVLVITSLPFFMYISQYLSHSNSLAISFSLTLALVLALLLPLAFTRSTFLSTNVFVFVVYLCKYVFVMRTKQECQK